MMRVSSVLAVALLGCAAFASVNAQPVQQYSWKADPAAFTVDTVDLQSTDGMPWEAGSRINAVIGGTANKEITAGTLKVQWWEEYVQHFEASSNLNYFHCDNKGCDPTNPICLYLNDPVANSTAYQLKFDAVLPAAQKTGAFRMVLWGQDQDHTPYDFSLTVQYNYTKMESSNLRGPEARLLAQA